MTATTSSLSPALIAAVGGLGAFAGAVLAQGINWLRDKAAWKRDDNNRRAQLQVERDLELRQVRRNAYEVLFPALVTLAERINSCAIAASLWSQDNIGDSLENYALSERERLIESAQVLRDAEISAKMVFASDDVYRALLKLRDVDSSLSPIGKLVYIPNGETGVRAWADAINKGRMLEGLPKLEHKERSRKERAEILRSDCVSLGALVAVVIHAMRSELGMSERLQPEPLTSVPRSVYAMPADMTGMP